MTDALSIRDLYPGCSTWPFWMMRQAGRTLPEYHILRNQANSFIDLVSSPKLIKEITLQPLHRFNLDAAIIFSDILLPLSHLPGIHLSFQDKSRPCLALDFRSLDALQIHLSCSEDIALYGVCEGISLVKQALAGQQLIGFCGGVWTVAAYIFGEKSPLDWPQIYHKLMLMPLVLQEQWVAILQELMWKTLWSQYQAGATQCMIFDSWAGYAPLALQERWIRKPMEFIVAKFKEKAPACPLIYYSQGLGDLPLVWRLPVHILACESGFSIGPHQSLPYVFQGNLNPNWIFLSSSECEEKVMQWRNALSQPVIVNLGSGLDPSTRLDKLTHFVSLVRKYTQ